MPIIGSGDIASVLKDRDRALFFAKGVSDSLCEDRIKFDRERSLLELAIEKANKWTDCLFYFGSISCYFKTTPYTKHKEEMEGLIRSKCNHYNLLRIGNINFGKNPHTFINYFRNCIEKGLPYKVFDEYRYLISKEELLLLTNNLPLTGKNEISVTGRIVKVQTIVDELIQEHERKLQARQ